MLHTTGRLNWGHGFEWRARRHDDNDLVPVNYLRILFCEALQGVLKVRTSTVSYDGSLLGHWHCGYCGLQPGQGEMRQFPTNTSSGPPLFQTRRHASNRCVRCGVYLCESCFEQHDDIYCPTTEEASDERRDVPSGPPQDASDEHEEPGEDLTIALRDDPLEHNPEDDPDIEARSDTPSALFRPSPPDRTRSRSRSLPKPPTLMLMFLFTVCWQCEVEA